MKKTDLFWSSKVSDSMTVSARETKQGVLIIFDANIPCIHIQADGRVVAHFKRETAAELSNLINYTLAAGNPKEEK